jgi:alpha-beta hydrolase superfamily lysophospholipase
MSIEELSADECLSFFRAFYRSLFGGYIDSLIQCHRLSTYSRITRRTVKPASVFVLGHSLGAYLSIMSLFDWENGKVPPAPLPENYHTDHGISTGVVTHISGLILASPAGILPSLSPHGAYWAVLFYVGMPMSILRSMGSTLASLLVIPWMQLGSNIHTLLPASHL